MRRGEGANFVAPTPSSDDHDYDDAMPEKPVSAAEHIRVSARTEAKVEALAETIRELKKTIEETVRELRRTLEEVVDRVDADIDSVRDKTEAVAVTAAAVEDLKRRVTILETKLDANGAEHATLKAAADEGGRRLLLLETKVDALQYRVWYASGSIGVLVWFASRFFK